MFCFAFFIDTKNSLNRATTKKKATKKDKEDFSLKKIRKKHTIALQIANNHIIIVN